MVEDLKALIATVRNPHLQRLLALLLGEDTECWQQYVVSPAAKHYHQAYRHGLLEHSLTVAQAVSATAAIFPGIDRDLAVTGALLSVPSLATNVAASVAVLPATVAPYREPAADEYVVFKYEGSKAA